MAVGIAAVVIVIGCASTGPARPRAGAVLGAGAERGGWATRGEIAWLTKLGHWEKALMRAIDAASNASSDAKAARFMGPIVDCTTNLRHEVGSPPTRRLQRAFLTLEHACEHLGSAASAASADDADAEGRRGGKLLLRADQMLPPGELRSLPVIAGEATVSRIDPKLGDIASALAGKRIEVRCWSRVDWMRLLREEKAYTLHHIDDDTLAFAGVSGTRANLSPEVCDSLGELLYHHWQPSSATAKLLVATAVVTLAHETQHSKGIAVEAQAECYAIQLMKETAVKLGARPGYATQLQRAYWAHYPQELASYRSPKCRNGGAYDVNAEANVFP